MITLRCSAGTMGRHIKRLCIGLLCLGVIGCTTLAERKNWEEKEDKELAILRNLLREKELQLQQKDAQIGELRKKLESFGVF